MVERSGVACAASGKSGGFLALDWCDDSALGPLARASFALHAELAKDIATDYGYRRVDTFMLAAREQGRLRGEHRVTPPRWLDGAGVVTAALGSTETTAQVHPASLHGRADRGRPARASRLGVVEEIVPARRRRGRRARRRRHAGSGRGGAGAGAVDEPRGGPAAAAHPRAQGLQRDAGRRRRAGARALRRLPHGRRPKPRAGDLSATGRQRLRVRHGRSAAAAGFTGRRGGRRRSVRGAGARRWASVARRWRRRRSRGGRPATARSPTTACR